MNTKTFKFDKIPNTVEELRSLDEYALTDPFEGAALTVLALCAYESGADKCYAMLDALKGSHPLSTLEKQFIRDRLSGKAYVPRSYFNGTSPQNNYTVEPPYEVTVFDGPYSYTDEGYALLYIRSTGADTERSVKLRRKGDQWFVWEIFLYPDIRIPAAMDDWA